MSPDSLAATSTRTAVAKARKLEPFIGQLEAFLFVESPGGCIASFEDVRKVILIDTDTDTDTDEDTDKYTDEDTDKVEDTDTDTDTDEDTDKDTSERSF